MRALFPERCPVCHTGQVVPGPCPRHQLCPESKVNRCRSCAAKMAEGLPKNHLCLRCGQARTRLHRVLTLGDYHSTAVLRDWILALKHGGRVELAHPLGLELAEAYRNHGLCQERPILVPVPLHRVRRLERGYNQALLLARVVAEDLGGEVLNALVRRRWTEAQGSAAASREFNVGGAFGLGTLVARGALRRAPKRAPVWLVDDVLTSGATLRACAEVLRSAGFRQVGALVVARAVRD